MFGRETKPICSSASSAEKAYARCRIPNSVLALASALLHLDAINPVSQISRGLFLENFNLLKVRGKTALYIENVWEYVGVYTI